MHAPDLRLFGTVTGRLIFGVGGLHRILTRQGRHRLLRHALDVGFASFDVAPSYGNGLNELELGQALSGRRSAVRITTKFGIPFDDYGARHPAAFPLIRLAMKARAASYRRDHMRRDWSRGTIVRSVNESLQRLRTDYVDRLLIHEPIAPLSAAEMDALAEQSMTLKRQGKILEFGVAGSGASTSNAAAQEWIDVIQAPLPEAIGSLSLIRKSTVGFGAHHAFMATGAKSEDFAAFVRRTLSAHERLEVIVASRRHRAISELASGID